MRGNKPIKMDSGRIVIEDKDLKLKLVEIAKKKNETIKETVNRLVDGELEK